MDPVNLAIEGFRPIDADPAFKEQAAKNLQRWLSEEDFRPYLPQIQWLIDSKQWAGLLDRFYQILPFGTGGRRGAVGIGPNRMNPWTLTASVQGHCEYLKERFPDVQPIHVALAFDVRRFEDQRKNYNPKLPNPIMHLSSRDFAQQAARVYAANGIHAHILPENSPLYPSTPELSFTIRFLKAQGGLNISASHNPPDDNGGKFYDEKGGQSVPPDDQIMADLVEQVDKISMLSWTEAVQQGRIHFLDLAAHKGYIDLCRAQSLVDAPRVGEIQLVYTPLSGVGSMQALEILDQQGFRVATVESQMKPDGQFANVTQAPNPEFPASLDKAQALAEEVGADLVLATDPDADRLGGMIPDGKSFRFLNGNTIAALLTHFKLSKLAQQGRMPRSPIVVKTLVTTGLVTRIARHFQAQVVDNLLVGFKYIGDVIGHLEETGAFGEVQGTPEDFIIGCEESHGILLMPQLRDKDGGAAALLMAELALDLKRRGQSAVAYLEDIERTFGYFRSDLTNIILTGITGKQKMIRMLEELRRKHPTMIAGSKVTAALDLQDETNWLGPFKGATDKAARNFLVFQMGDEARIALRPSGTEPKAKAYIEVCTPPKASGTSDADWLKQCQAADEKVRLLAKDFSRICTEAAG